MERRAMEGPLQKHPSRRDSKFGYTFAKACLVLEGTVLGLLSEGWEEDPRRLTHQMAEALRRAARDAGWWDRESTLRAIESLLALSSTQVSPIRRDAGDKLLQLLALLKNASASRSA